MHFYFLILVPDFRHSKENQYNVRFHHKTGTSEKLLEPKFYDCMKYNTKYHHFYHSTTVACDKILSADTEF